MTKPITADDPRVLAEMRRLHSAAVEAGYDDHLFGALLIAAIALVGIEEEASAGRHPGGKASPGVD